MQTPKIIILSTIYTVLLMILISLDGTYNITYSLFGNLLNSKSQNNYGLGMNLKSKGFILHTVLFAILIIVPMLFCKSN